jgi:hypothetical protein
MYTLIDDVSQPTLRFYIGRLLSDCVRADIAVGHVRLSALDLTADETRGIRHCRILLGRLEARALTEFGFVDERSDERLHALLDFLDSGRVEIRSAGIGAWWPDFSIYRESIGVRGGACLVGAHYFRDPVTANGPSFTALLRDDDAVACALSRFEELWERSHDVLEPVIAAIRHRQSFSAT